MNEKVLVIYACGGVGSDAVATVVAEVLASQRADVTLLSATDCEGVDGCDLVVIGMDLWKGEVPAEALAFVRAHEGAFASAPTACFAVSLSLEKNTEENRRLAAECLRSVTELVKPMEVGLFAGALDPARLPALPRVAHRLLGRRSRDVRDWDAVRFWAGGLLSQVRGE